MGFLADDENLLESIIKEMNNPAFEFNEKYIQDKILIVKYYSKYKNDKSSIKKVILSQIHQTPWSIEAWSDLLSYLTRYRNLFKFYFK